MFPTLYKSTWLTLYSYPILLGFSWAIAFQYYEQKISDFITNKQRRLFLFWGSFLCSWIGAKVFFLIFSAKEAMGQMSTQANFWIGGGFVFYGGLFAGFSFLWIVTKILKINQWDYFSKLAPILALSHCIGRVGCALAGCCFGREFDFLGGRRLPTHIIEAIFLFILWRMLKSGDRKNLFIYPIGYASFRFLIEFFRGDLIRGEIANGISTSQGLSILVILMTGVWFAVYKKTLKV